MIRTLAILLALPVVPALADLDAALDSSVLPGMAQFAQTTATLADVACDPDAAEPAFTETAQA